MQELGIKKRILDDVISAAEAHKKKHGLEDLFNDPIIGYASVKNPLFKKFFDLDWSQHPKEIYRPGSTVIVHFLPFTQKVVESNRKGAEISEEWVKAYNSALLFSAKINDSIIETLQKIGRLSSLTNIPKDWNEERGGPNWSHKLAAFVAGMGDFGIAGSFNTTVGSAGRFGSIITELTIEPSKEWPEWEDSNVQELDSIISEIKKSHMIKGGEEIVVDDSKVFLCPVKAISTKGVDLDKCREFCAAQNQIVPASDVCGKCFN